MWASSQNAKVYGAYFRKVRLVAHFCATLRLSLESGLGLLLVAGSSRYGSERCSCLGFVFQRKQRDAPSLGCTLCSQHSQQQQLLLISNSPDFRPYPEDNQFHG